jgi:hypothetical protein
VVTDPPGKTSFVGLPYISAMLRSTLVVVALAASMQSAAAFLPSSVTGLRANARLARASSTRCTPVFMSATAPKERTVRAPVFDEICSETGVTLSRYMMELARENPELRDLESLIGGIQQV